MTHADLTELQIEISELEKENQDLKQRLQELEVNLAYVEQQLQKDATATMSREVSKKPTLSVVSNG